MTRKSGWRASLVIAVAAGIAWLGWDSARLHIPDRWNPWAPLVIDDVPNLLTPYKLNRLRHEPVACRAALEGSTLRFTPQPDRAGDKGCGWENALRITAGATAAVSQPFVLECPAAVALALWERHSVQPLALRHFGAPVTRIDHLGSYACRNIGGEAGGRRSEHASANALDVAGFVFANGSRARVATDWSREDARGRFLREAHDGACRFWHVVLGPDYNAAHRDHLHLDLGGFRACR